jgi:hypothetical protein
LAGPPAGSPTWHDCNRIRIGLTRFRPEPDYINPNPIKPYFLVSWSCRVRGSCQKLPTLRAIGLHLFIIIKSLDWIVSQSELSIYRKHNTVNKVRRQCALPLSLYCSEKEKRWDNVISELFQTRLIDIISIQFVLYCSFDVRHRKNSVNKLYYKIEFESLSFSFFKDLKKKKKSYTSFHDPSSIL